jgi:hypothetical protein
MRAVPFYHSTAGLMQREMVSFGGPGLASFGACARGEDSGSGFVSFANTARSWAVFWGSVDRVQQEFNVIIWRGAGHVKGLV